MARYGQALPRDVRQLVLWHVRGYERRRRLRQAGTLTAMDACSLQAVEGALSGIGPDIGNEGVRGKLRAGILLSCERGRERPYERLDLPTVGREEFYRRRNEFLRDVAGRLGYL